MEPEDSFYEEKKRNPLLNPYVIGGGLLAGATAMGLYSILARYKSGAGSKPPRRNSLNLDTNVIVAKPQSSVNVSRATLESPDIPSPPPKLPKALPPNPNLAKGYLSSTPVSPPPSPPVELGDIGKQRLDKIRNRLRSIWESIKRNKNPQT